MNAVDTNILVYAHDPREIAKQSTAVALIKSLNDGVLLWQVACEYIATSRKLKSVGYSEEQARQDIRDLQTTWTTSLPRLNILTRSESLSKRYSLSFWDSLIIAACLDAQVERLYSEDFDAYSKIDDLELVNPFK